MNSDIFHICNANAADLFLNVKVKRTSPNGISAVSMIVMFLEIMKS